MPNYTKENNNKNKLSDDQVFDEHGDGELSYNEVAKIFGLRNSNVESADVRKITIFKTPCSENWTLRVTREEQKALYLKIFRGEITRNQYYEAVGLPKSIFEEDDEYLIPAE